MISPHILDNLINSVTFLILLFLGILIMGVLALISRINRNERLNRDTLSKLDLLERIVMNARVPTLVIDDRGMVYLCNNEAAKLLGKHRDEIEYDLLEPFTLISSSRAKLADMRTTVRNNQTYKFEAEAGQRPNRQKMDFSISGITSGPNARYLTTFRPSEDKSRESYEKNLLESRLNEVENAGGLGFWVYSYDTKETTWSRGMYKILGKEVNSVIPDLSFFQQFAPESRASAQELLMAIKNKEPYQDRMTILGDDGISRVVDVTVKHQDGLDMDVYKTLGVMHEVTDEQELVNELNSSNEFWKSISARGDIAIVVTDRANRIDFVNNYAASVVNMTNQELLGKEFQDYFGFHIIPPTEIIKNSKPFYTTSLRNLEDGGESIFLWSSTVVSDGDERPYMNVNLGIDLTRSAKNLEIIKAQYES